MKMKRSLAPSVTWKDSPVSDTFASVMNKLQKLEPGTCKDSFRMLTPEASKALGSGSNATSKSAPGAPLKRSLTVRKMGYSSNRVSPRLTLETQVSEESSAGDSLETQQKEEIGEASQTTLSSDILEISSSSDRCPSPATALPPWMRWTTSGSMDQLALASLEPSEILQGLETCLCILKRQTNGGMDMTENHSFLLKSLARSTSSHLESFLRSGRTTTPSGVSSKEDLSSFVLEV